MVVNTQPRAGDSIEAIGTRKGLFVWSSLKQWKFLFCVVGMVLLEVRHLVDLRSEMS